MHNTGLAAVPCTLLGATRVLNNNTNASSTVWRRPHRHMRTPPAFRSMHPSVESLSHFFPLSPVLENVSHVRLQLSCVGGIAFSDGVVVCDACRFLPHMAASIFCVTARSGSRPLRLPPESARRTRGRDVDVRGSPPGSRFDWPTQLKVLGLV